MSDHLSEFKIEASTATRKGKRKAWLGRNGRRFLAALSLTYFGTTRVFFLGAKNVYTFNLSPEYMLMDPLLLRKQAVTNHDVKEELSGCLTEQCIQTVAQELARVYPPIPDKQLWCQNAPPAERRGLIMVKVPKGASSTSSGVTQRLAHRHNCSAVHWKHRPAWHYQNSTKAILLTSIRDPSKRAVSGIFFHFIGRKPTYQKDTQKSLLKLLNSETDVHYGATSDGQGGFQLRYTSLEAIQPYSAWNRSVPSLVQSPQTSVHRVTKVLNDYNMMLVAERMDESVVCLALLLGVDVGDVLVMPSKVSGGSMYHALPLRGGQFHCQAIMRSTVGTEVARYLASDTWRAQNYGDLLLHAAANASLDRTIASLQPQFDKAMRRYRTLQVAAVKTCANETFLPCSEEGRPQIDKSRESCYPGRGSDRGCGYKCVDRIVDSWVS